MSTETETRLIRDEETLVKQASAGAVGLSVVVFLLSWLSLFRVTEPSMSVAGAELYDVYGAVFLTLGVGGIAVGLGSYYEFFETRPSDSAGLVTAGAFGALWFGVAGLFVSQTLGIDGPLGLGWLVPGLVVGAAVTAATAVVPEDVGSTVPSSALAVLAGLLILTGVFGPEWTWNPNDIQATFSADIVVPLLGLLLSLLVAWSAAKAYAGFGARGRQLGAYLLVGTNAAMMLTLLFLLIAFITVRGLPGVLAGVEFGLGTGPPVVIDLWVTSFTFYVPFEVPFVMNSYALMNDINGVLPAVFGTFWLALGAVIVSVPTGVGAAIFLTEYAEEGRFTRTVEVATNGLWSTPSIVYGLFGLAFLVPRLGNSASLLAGQLVLGFMLLPLVVITTAESIQSVPDEYRDASVALGVSKWQTIRSVVLPAALPGIVTGVILGVGRIAGETAPILLVTSSSMAPFPDQRFIPRVIQGFEFTTSPPFITNSALLDASSALPYQLYALITAGVGGGAGGGSDIDPWSTALVLLVVVLSFYAVGIATRSYFRGRLQS